MAFWNVHFDLLLMRDVKAWPSIRRVRLLAIRDLLVAEGPEGFDVFPRASEGRDWASLDRPVNRICIAPFDLEFFRLGWKSAPASM